MKNNYLNVLVPMAGEGKRFKDAGYNLPKPLIDINGIPMIVSAIKSLNIEAKYTYIVQEKHFNKYDLKNLLNEITPNCNIIKIQGITDGAARTTLFAESVINNENPLIIFNSDQIIEWDSEQFKKFINNEMDGAIVTFKSSGNKWSYVKINKLGFIEEVAEKIEISNDATAGIYYWSSGSDYVKYAKQMIEKNIRVNNEFYVAPVYNEAIKDDKVIYPFLINKMWGVGTPEDLEVYLSKQKEYYTEKPKTIFCDIDGTIVKHVHRFSSLYNSDPIILNGVLEKFNEWDAKGYKIILTTARKESARQITEKQLHGLGICWDLLIMGVTSGHRILINDKLYEEDSDRSVAINVITDSGFKNINWENYGI